MIWKNDYSIGTALKFCTDPETFNATQILNMLQIYETHDHECEFRCDSSHETYDGLTLLNNNTYRDNIYATESEGCLNIFAKEQFLYINSDPEI